VTLGRREEAGGETFLLGGMGEGWLAWGGLFEMIVFLISWWWCPLPFPTPQFQA